MKNFKLLALLVLVFSFASCSSDEEPDNTGPMDIEIDGSVDINALNNLVGTDATALVTFNGESAATFTSEAIPGDKLYYKIDNSTANTEVRIIDFRFNLQGSTVSDIDWEENVTVFIDTISRPAIAYVEINPGAATDDTGFDEYKFDIDFKVYTSGASNHTVYYTDPKIKIKSRR